MRKLLVVVGTLCLVLVMAVGLSADVKSQHKTQLKFEGMLGRVVGMFGGKAAKEGVVNTVAISGDKMMTVTEQNGELVDLAAEKVYRIDFKGKSYTVKTFAEIRKEWEEGQAKMKEQAAQHTERADQHTERADQQAGEPQYEVDFSVDKTGERKSINGYDCQLVVMTIAVRPKGKKLEDGGGIVMTNDMWMGPNIPALHEQIAFQMRYMKQLLGNDTETMTRDLAQAMAMYPQMKTAMARMQKESGKFDGTAILTTMKVETVMSPEQAQAREGQPQAGVGGMTGMLGGLLNRKKKTDETQKEPQAAAGPANRSTFLTATNELLSVETSVSAADVEVPAGFKQK